MDKCFADGGCVDKSRHIYARRKEDVKLKELIIDDCSTVYVNGPRAVGKSSLVRSVTDDSNEVITINVDLRFYSRKEYTPENWFLMLFQAIDSSLSFVLPNFRHGEVINWFRTYSSEYSSQANYLLDFFKLFIRGEKNIKRKFVIVFDEVDVIQSNGYHTDNFLTGIVLLNKELQNLNLSQVLISISHPMFLVRELKYSDIKIGTRIIVNDFENIDEITMKDWAEGLFNINEESRLKLTKEIIEYTGGHPYISGIIGNIINSEYSGNIENNTLKKIIDQFITDQKSSSNINPHFEAPRDFILMRPSLAYEVLDFYEQVIAVDGYIDLDIEKKTANDPKLIIAVLSITGLVRRHYSGQYKCRSYIYRRIFNDKWVGNTKSHLGSRLFSGNVLASHKRSDLPKIGLINCGGTLGMTEHDGKIQAPSNEEEFYRMFPSLSHMADVRLIPFRIKDGANMFIEDYSELAKHIYLRRDDGFDAFIIMHGTDTLTYTASGVAFALGKGLNCPVVFVASQAPVSVRYGDAEINLKRAFAVATMKINEVVICFNDSVFRAVRTEKLSDYRFNGFHSPTYPAIATISEKIELSEKWSSENETNKSSAPEYMLNNEFEPNILQIVQYPGINPKNYEDIVFSCGSKVKAIIIQSLGLGNLPTMGEYNFLPFISRAVSKNIPVVITSKYPILPEFVEKYIPASRPVQSGAIHAGNMTPSAALTKLSWILKGIYKEVEIGITKVENLIRVVERKMKTNYIGELD